MSGVLGVYLTEEATAAELVYLGLYGLQHRGQESAGIAVSDRERIRIRKGMGLVSQVFEGDELEALPGKIGIGHVRYATTGAPHVVNAQPLVALSHMGQVAIAHDGNLTNGAKLRQRLMRQGALFQTGTDSEVILNLIAQNGGDSLADAFSDTVKILVGSATLIAMSTSQLIGYRDPLGTRPLSLGTVPGGFVLASETSAFSTIGAEYVRDVEPGEMLVVDEQGVKSLRPTESTRQAFCVFEYIYLARPDSELLGQNVHRVRREIGRVLAQEHRVEADVVIPTPDSGISASMGYAQEAGIEYEIGLVKNRYVGRTFINPTQGARQVGVRIKLNPVPSVVKGKRVILIDDSIVRGNTTPKAIRMLRESGAKEVHMVVASPPFLHPCHYGIDVPESGQLVAAERSVEEVCTLIGADSLHYLSLEGLIRAVGISADRLCTGCFSGVYPTPTEATAAADLFEDVIPLDRHRRDIGHPSAS